MFWQLVTNFAKTNIAQRMIEGVIKSKEQGKCMHKIVDYPEKELDENKNDFSLKLFFSQKTKISTIYFF